MARKTTSRRGARRAPDALQMLKDDHRRVEALLERFEKARSEQQKEKLAATICNELTVNARLEEEIFYPAVRGAIEDDDLMNEAMVEHATAKQLIAQIEAASSSDEMFDALVTVLGEYVQHHVKEEEREMFKEARRAKLDLVRLADSMRARRKELLAVSADGRSKERRERSGQYEMRP